MTRKKLGLPCVFDLLLYKHGKQLKSCRDGQFSLPRLTEAVNWYSVLIHSPDLGSEPANSRMLDWKHYQLLLSCLTNIHIEES